MARATLYLKRPIDKIDVNIEENNLKVYGFVNADVVINELAKLARTDDGMVKIVEVMKVINDLSHLNFKEDKNADNR